MLQLIHHVTYILKLWYPEGWQELFHIDFAEAQNECLRKNVKIPSKYSDVHVCQFFSLNRFYHFHLTYKANVRLVVSDCRNICQALHRIITKSAVTDVLNDKTFIWMFTRCDAVELILHRGHLAKSGLLAQSQKRCQPAGAKKNWHLCC